jgi:hypothetical protein
MSNANDQYLKPGFSTPKSPTHSAASKNVPINMSRSSSYDPHKALGYFDLPSRSAPSSPQTSYIPFSPVSRSSSPAGRDVRRSRDLNFSHSGSDIEDTLTGFSLVPNWLKMAMEQDQHSNQTQKSAPRRPYKYSPLNSPDSVVSSSNDASPITPRTPQLNVALPQNEESTKEKSEQKKEQVEDEEYWAEEDEGYFGELDEDEDEDLEEIYRSVR